MNTNFDFDNSRCEVRAHSDGHYVQKAFNVSSKTICKLNGFTLESYNETYRILCDGDVVNKYPTLREAEVFFIDFADTTRAKYKKAVEEQKKTA